MVHEPPRKMFDELVVPADSVIGLQVETGVTTERAKLEDKVAARVTRDVKMRDQVAIPAGARRRFGHAGRARRALEGSGAARHPVPYARAGRWHSPADQYRHDLPRGRVAGEESAAKIGGAAVGGAVLGAIFGGKKGAVIGSTVGAAGGGVAVAASEPNAATLPAGSTVTVRMGSPATVTVER